jgi:hypothetical protein
MLNHAIEQKVENGRAIAKRLVVDLNVAQSSWAHWEAINGETAGTRRKFREAISQVWGSPVSLTAALLRDTLMALSRIVDKTGKASLLKIRPLLISNKQFLIDRAREFSKFEATLIEEKITCFIDTVPKQWDNHPPRNSDLYDWRKPIEKLRHEVLAHSDPLVELDKIQLNEIRRGFELIWPLVKDAHHIFDGSQPPDGITELKKRANQFWDYAEVGFIQAFEEQNVEWQKLLNRLKSHSS